MEKLVNKTRSTVDIKADRFFQSTDAHHKVRVVVNCYTFNIIIIRITVVVVVVT